MSELFYEIGKICGIIGFFLLSFLIFSGDTARFWNRFVGLDKIIKFQRKFSYFVAFFVICHPIFFILANGFNKDFIIPNFAYTPLAIGVIAMYIFIGVMIASNLYKMISYRAWQYIHILTYILFFFAMFHAYNAGSDSGAITPYYNITLLAVFIGIIYRTQYKLRARKTNKFKVKNIYQNTHDTFTITVDGYKNFIAGQFCFLRLNKNKLHARHPFTISSMPGEDMNFTIKLAGRFTQTAKELNPGDEIIIDGPFGNFIPKTDKDLVFIAGGVGITPFMSILKDRIKKGIDQNITLIYGSRTEADIIFKKEIDAIDKVWFKKIYLLSLTEEGVAMSADCEKGFICDDVLKRYVKDIKGSLYYICGPEIMKDNAKKLLKENGVPSGHVFVEDFFW
jgi:predicted ferric reductase